MSESERQRRYTVSEKGKARRARYKASEKGREATRRYRRKRYVAGIARENSIKLAGCADCGAGFPVPLDFHHVDPSAKTINVTMLRTASDARFLAEFEKCVVLCEPCHIARHVDLRRRSETATL